VIEFNPNVLQLVLWAWAGYYFAKVALHNKLRQWLKLAFLLALALYAKYSIILLCIGYAIFFLAHNQTRGTLKTYKPYLAIAVCGLLFAPHIKWLIDHDFIPLSYTKGRLEQAVDLTQWLIFPAKFASSQFATLLPALLLAAITFWPFKKSAQTKDDHLKKNLLIYLAFAPLLMSLCYGLFTGQKMRDMWGMPYLSFIPLWLMVHFTQQTLIEKRFKFFIKGWAVLLALSLMGFATHIYLPSIMNTKPLRAHFPGAELSNKINDLWREQTDQPLKYIIGNAWMAGNVAYYTPPFHNRPHVIIDGDPQINSWLDISDVKKDGAILIWLNDNEMPNIKALGLIPTINQSFSLFSEEELTRARLTINWAMIPPAKQD